MSALSPTSLIAAQTYGAAVRQRTEPDAPERKEQLSARDPVQDRVAKRLPEDQVEIGAEAVRRLEAERAEAVQVSRSDAAEEPQRQQDYRREAPLVSHQERDIPPGTRLDISV